MPSRRGYFDPTALTIQGEGVQVEVDQTLTATIRFEPPVALPPRKRRPSST